MHYVYILESLSDGGFYIGCTKDLKKRIREHKTGRSAATRNRRPVKLIYYEASLDKDDAFRREKYLKTTYGRRYIKNRLRAYFTG
jgi:putative endonuclease